MSNGKPLMVHVFGFGKNTDVSVKQKVIAVANNALQHHKSNKMAQFEENIQIASIASDQLIAQVPQQISNAGDTASQIFKDNEAEYKLCFVINKQPSVTNPSLKITTLWRTCRQKLCFGHALRHH